MPVSNPNAKMIVIDTTSYAGNFERELCAYVTGRYGECGAAAHIAAAARSEILHGSWWDAHTQEEADERDCRRPVSIWPTPGWFNNGFGGHYVDDPANYDEGVAAAVESARKYHDDHEAPVRDRLARRNFEPAEKLGAWTEEACLRTLSANEDHVRRISERRTRYPAYLSVAIFIDEFPPEDVLDEMKVRAADFFENYRRFNPYSAESIDLIGFRMIDPNLDAVDSPRA